MSLPSGLPEHVSDDEDLARFLTSSNHFNSTAVRLAAFMPNPRNRCRSTCQCRQCDQRRESRTTPAPRAGKNRAGAAGRRVPRARPQERRSESRHRGLAPQHGPRRRLFRSPSNRCPADSGRRVSRNPTPGGTVRSKILRNTPGSSQLEGGRKVLLTAFLIRHFTRLRRPEPPLS